MMLKKLHPIPRTLRKLLLLALPFVAWQALETLVLPPQLMAFRPWDAMTNTYHPANKYGPFIENHSFRMLSTGYQDFVLGRPNPKQKWMTWETDRHGFRNFQRPDPVDGYDFMFHGDSNFSGSFMDQKDMINEVLARMCRCDTFILGGKWLADEKPIRTPPKFIVDQFYPDLLPQATETWRFLPFDLNVREKRETPKWLMDTSLRFYKQPFRQWLRSRVGITFFEGAVGGAASIKANRERFTHSADEAIDNIERNAVAQHDRWKAKGTDVIFLFMPAPVDRYAVFKDLRERLKKRGFLVVDFQPTDEYPNGYPDDFWQTADSHWTEKAVVETARRVYEVALSTGRLEKPDE